MALQPMHLLQLTVFGYQATRLGQPMTIDGEIRAEIAPVLDDPESSG